MSKLARIGSRSFLTQRALAHVLEDLDKLDAPPTAKSRSSIKRAHVAAISDPESLLPMLGQWDVITVDGGTMPVPFVWPAAVLSMMCKRSPGFSELLQQTFRARPPTPERPYRIVVYADEITPGNALKADNRRKTWAFYWSIADTCLQLLFEAPFGTRLRGRAFTSRYVAGCALFLVCRGLSIDMRSRA